MLFCSPGALVVALLISLFFLVFFLCHVIPHDENSALYSHKLCSGDNKDAGSEHGFQRDQSRIELSNLRKECQVTGMRASAGASFLLPCHSMDVPMKPLIVSLDFLEFPPIAYLRRGEPLTCHPARRDCPLHRLPSWSSTRSRSPAVRSHRGSAGTSRRVPVIPAGIPREGITNSARCRCAGNNRLWDDRVYGSLSPAGQHDPVPVQGVRARYHARPAGGSDKHALIAAMKGHVLQFGETVAICSR